MTLFDLEPKDLTWISICHIQLYICSPFNNIASLQYLGSCLPFCENLTLYNLEKGDQGHCKKFHAMEPLSVPIKHNAIFCISNPTERPKRLYNHHIAAYFCVWMAAINYHYPHTPIMANYQVGLFKDK